MVACTLSKLVTVYKVDRETVPEWGRGSPQKGEVITAGYCMKHHGYVS
jgi:hypothetical protein